MSGFAASSMNCMPRTRRQSPLMQETRVCCGQPDLRPDGSCTWEICACVQPTAGDASETAALGQLVQKTSDVTAGSQADRPMLTVRVDWCRAGSCLGPGYWLGFHLRLHGVAAHQHRRAQIRVPAQVSNHLVRLQRQLAGRRQHHRPRARPHRMALQPGQQQTCARAATFVCSRLSGGIACKYQRRCMMRQRCGGTAN